MRIVHLCKATGNGGFIAAWRLHEALLLQGIDSVMVVRERGGRDDLDLIAFDDSRLWWFWFRLRGLFSRILHAILLGPGSIREFYLQWVPTFLPWAIRRRLKPDILHVHSADDGLWSLWELSRWPQPIVWTFHAYRDFSQGYIYLAHRFQRWFDAGQSAAIHDRDERMIPHINLALKKKMMSKRWDICIAPSHFVHEAGKISGVFLESQHVMIRNAVPLDSYRETGGEEWRKQHGVKHGQFVLLVGAHSLDYKIKGFDLFVDCLSQNLPQARKMDLVLALFGGGRAPEALHQAGRVIELGYLDDTSLRAAYSGADLFVIPSREDNFPNVIIEALACGLPYVGFDVGGVGDMVREDAACGKVVPAFDLVALMAALQEWHHNTASQRDAVRLAARSAVARVCSPDSVATEHCQLYQYAIQHQTTEGLMSSFLTASR